MTSGFDALADLVRGATFDDFLLRPQYSVIARRDPSVIDLSCRFSTNITLKRPLVSANMDTVTRAPMAIVQAEEGGLGIIDRGFRSGDIEPQVREVEKVKRMQHIIIRDPYAVTPSTPLADAVAMMRRTRAGTLVVVEGPRRLKGLLTERDVRFVNTKEGTVASRMTPVEQLVKGEGELTLDVAERLMVERKVKKLPLVDKSGTLIGLITAKDITRQERLPFATRDGHGRLRVGAAIGATGDYLERAAELVKAHVDVIVIDIAHGHSMVMAKAIDEFRKTFPTVELVAGNVATAAGVRFLADRGVNAVMLGSMFAGTEETPGDTVQKTVVLPDQQRSVKVPFKVLRGMASIQAIRDRLDVEDDEDVDLESIGAEGTEVSVPARGSVRPIIHDILKHLCSSISYGGAKSLAELRTMFREDPMRYLVKLSASAKKESYE